MERGELCLPAVFAAVFFPSLTIAATPVGFESDFNSHYVWRGLVQDESPVVQASVWGSIGNLEVGVWGNWPTTREAASVLPNELDFTAAFPLEWVGTEVEPSAAAYWYPGQVEAPATCELALRLSRALGPVSVFSSHSIDVAACPGAYYGDLGAEWERELLPGLGATVSVCTGWASAEFNATYAGPARWALNAVEAEAAATWQILPFLYLRPHIAASSLVDAELRAAVARPAAVVMGLAAGLGF